MIFKSLIQTSYHGWSASFTL